MHIQTAIKNVISGKNLSRTDMNTVMKTIMQGEATPAQIGGLLVALRLKGESVDEITAAAEVMRELVKAVDVDKTNLVDTCGTGGDGVGTFNISTTSAFVAAAAGVKVAKHGNRSVSSKSGSADVLATAGVNLELSAEQIKSCIENIGIGFMFAPMHHSAMKYAIGPRRELGIRTLFNVLGPLTNPASAQNQVVGVFDKHWLLPLAETLKQLGSKKVLVVHAEDGLDEISIAAKTSVVELREGQIKQYDISPADFDMKSHELTSLMVSSIDDSLSMMRSVLANENNAAKDIVCLNAGAAIYVSGITASLATGVTKAQTVIESGAAKEKFEQFIEYSQSFKV